RMMNDDDTLVLDVRLEKEYKEGHILGSVHIPLGALESRIRELDQYKGNTVVIYCQTGMRSKQAGNTLKKHGFENMFNIDGGLGAWAAANLPVNKTEKRKNKKS
ncbi:MAG: rhodanese-like domain-containing protein, partial [Gammaproteobacteria bacterium]|nr:rhodanese-like domain-containing protein [Gammaproteobacteria bacterium]